jgi:hypothetical protein
MNTDALPSDIDPESRCRLPLPNRDDLDEAGQQTFGLCRKFCSGGREGAVAPVGGEIRRPGSRTVRPQ